MELARRAAEAFNQRDLDAFAALMTEDFEWVGAFLGNVEGGSYRGREGLERYFREAQEKWEGFEAPGLEFRDLGNRVLVLGRMKGRGRTSGVELQTTYTMVVEFRGGKISRSHAYLSHGETLRAAGLEG